MAMFSASRAPSTPATGQASHPTASLAEVAGTMAEWYALQGCDAAKYKTQLCSVWANGQTCCMGCFHAHGQTELRTDVTGVAKQWRAKQMVRIVHELPDGVSWLSMEHRTRPCIEFLQTGACPAGDACRCAHSPEQLQPRPLPTPELRAWLASAGWQLPTAEEVQQAEQPRLQFPYSANYVPGAWQAAQQIEAAAVQRAAAAAAAAASGALSDPASTGGAAVTAGVKRAASEGGSGSGGAPKRQNGGAAAATAAACGTAQAGGVKADASHGNGASHDSSVEADAGVEQLQRQLGEAEAARQFLSSAKGALEQRLETAEAELRSYKSSSSATVGTQPEGLAAGGTVAGADAEQTLRQLSEADAARQFLASAKESVQQRLEKAEAELRSQNSALAPLQAKLLARDLEIKKLKEQATELGRAGASPVVAAAGKAEEEVQRLRVDLKEMEVAMEALRQQHAEQLAKATAAAKATAMAKASAAAKGTAAHEQIEAAKREAAAARAQLAAAEEDLQRKDGEWTEMQDRVKEAEAGQAAAQREAAAAVIEKEAAQRVAQSWQSRVKTLEETTRTVQQHANHAMNAAEPSRLRAELALAQREADDLERQLAERDAKLAAAQVEADSRGQQVEQVQADLQQAQQQAQHAQQQQAAAVAKVHQQEQEREMEAEALREQLAAANARCQHVASEAAAAQAAIQQQQQQQQQASEQTGKGAGGSSTSTADEARSLRQQLARATKKLEITQGVVKRDAEKHRRVVDELKAHLAAAQAGLAGVANSAGTPQASAHAPPPLLSPVPPPLEQQQHLKEIAVLQEQLAAAQGAAAEVAALHEQLAAAKAGVSGVAALQEQLAAAHAATAEAQQEQAALQQRVAELEANSAAAAAAGPEAPAGEGGQAQEALQQAIGQHQDRLVQLALQLGQAQQAAASAQQQRDQAQQAAAEQQKTSQQQLAGLQEQLAQVQAQLAEQQAAASKAQQQLTQQVEQLQQQLKAAEEAGKAGSPTREEEEKRWRRKVEKVEDRLQNAEKDKEWLREQLAAVERERKELDMRLRAGRPPGTMPPGLRFGPPVPLPLPPGYSPLERHVVEVCDAAHGSLHPMDFRDPRVLELLTRMSDRQAHEFLDWLGREAARRVVGEPCSFILDRAQDFLPGL